MSDTSREELKDAAVHGVRWTAMSRPIIEVVLMASMVVLARLIGPGEFGRTSVALAVSELAVLIPSQGVITALVQRESVDRGHLQAGFALAMLSAIVLAAITLVLAQVVAVPVFGHRTAEFIRLVTPGFLLAGLAAVPMAQLTRRLDFRALSVIDIINTIVRSVASVGLAIAGLNGEALIFGGLLGGVLATGIAWVKAPPPLPVLRRGPAKDILQYGMPASLAAISWVGFRNCDYAIVGARLGAVQAGLYFRAYTLAIEYQKKVSLVMGQVGFPVLARSQDAEHMSELRVQMVRLLTVTLFPCLAILAIVAPVLVPWVFGAEWTAAAVPTQVLALGGASTLVIDAAGAVLMASRRPRAMLVYGWAHFAAYAGGVFVIAPYGLTAVAITAAVVHAVFLLVAYQLMVGGRGPAALRTLWTDTGPALTSCLGLGAAAVPVALLLSNAHTAAPVFLVVVGMVASSAYLVTLRAAFPATWNALFRFVLRLLPGERMPRMRRRLALAGER